MIAALVHAQRADAVAGAEEREVTLDQVVEERRHLGLDPDLCLGLVARTRVERAAPDEDAGQVVEIEVRHGLGLETHPAQLVRRQPAEPQERRVLGVGRAVFGARREQHERLHPRRLPAPGAARDRSGP